MLNRHERNTLILLSFSIFLIYFPATIPKVTAQTTAITNLQYPSQVVLQNGVAEATVTFTVSYSGLPSGGALVFGILQKNTTGGFGTIKGSTTSTPDPCASLAGSTLTGTANCLAIPRSSSGTESASFTLILDSPQQYSLGAYADMVDMTSDKAISGSVSRQTFAISVTAETVSTSQSANAQLTSTSTLNPTSGMPDWVMQAIITGLIGGLVVRRRKRRSAGGPAAGLGAASMPPVTPAAIAETKFCTTCGARINATANFCMKCGAQQN